MGLCVLKETVCCLQQKETVNDFAFNLFYLFFLPFTDNLYINSQNGYYYHSQTSLDCPPFEYNSGGRLRNGSVYSAHSTSSLTNPQHYLQPSPMSSNPSITSDITRPDYVPSHRHSALIPPSYRNTPDYETVIRQKTRVVGGGGGGGGGGMMFSQEHRQSHSMRNLNIGNSYAYSRPDPLVYSQPEIRGEHGGGAAQHHHYPFHLGSSFHSPSPYPYPTERRPVVGAVSVPELTNVQLQQAQEYPAPNIMKTQVYRPPPPYPYAHPRPANSTPDLSRHLYVSSSNPDLITRRVHHSVQTFQEDSLPVAHSLQEVSEPLYSGPLHRHPYSAQKRNSIEIAGLTHSIEAMRVKERTVSSSSAAEIETPPPVMRGGRSHGSQLNMVLERAKTEERGDIKEDAHYGHKKSLSDATMLVHSSDDEEYFEDDSGRHTPLSQDAIAAIVPEQMPQQHPSMTSLSSLLSQQQTPIEPPPAYPIGSSLSPSVTGSLTYKIHPLIQDTEPLYLLSELRQPRIMPSVSEGDLSGQVKLKPKQEFKKRPVSDVFAGKKTIEGLPPPVSLSLNLLLYLTHH